VQQQLAAAARQAPQAPAAEPTDGYLSRISEESIAVLRRFGPEAPSKLNAYAVEVENALLESLGHQHRQAQALQKQQEMITGAREVLDKAIAERKAMMHILSDPSTLADYTVKFFGPDGAFPVQTPAEETRGRLQEGMVRSTGGNMIPTFNGADFEPRQAQAQAQVAPRQAMPTPDQAQMPQAGRGNAWDAFRFQAANDITQAWRILDQADPQALRGKIMVAE
jgi:hypothetical protein